MTVSNPTMSLLDSVLNAQTTRQKTAIALLKKAQDTMKQEGQAMVQLIEQAGEPIITDTHLDAYA